MTMDPTRLWAKSKRDNEGEVPSMLLPGHLADVYHAAEKVLDATAADQLVALGLKEPEYLIRLRRCVLLAAAVHDLGKANDHFQGMICRVDERKETRQGLRHEWVTVLMLKSLREWLFPAIGRNEIDFAIVEWAVAGHHPAHDHESPPRLCPPGAGVEIELHCGHSTFTECLRWIETTLVHTPGPSLGRVKRNLVGTENVFAELVAWSKAARRTWERMNPGEKRLVAAVKDSLVAADIAGSALPPKIAIESERWEWISQSFASKPKPGDLQAVVAERSKTFAERNRDRERFQSAVANSTAGVTYVKAGCGSGKTLAAYMWAAKNYPTRRIYFCYPTTGTATEGFKDYLYEPDVRADLFHSRRDVDFEIILNTGDDTKNTAADAAIRIDSLDAWSTPIVACTVGFALGLLALMITVLANNVVAGTNAVTWGTPRRTA